MEERTMHNHKVWGKQLDLNAITKKNKIELMNFYTKKLKEIQFTRDNVVIIRSNADRV